MTLQPIERKPLVPAVADAPIWERLKGESGTAFAHFCRYRNQTRGQHSLRRLAADLGRSLSTLRDLSVTWHWQERVDAYDDYLDRRDRELRESEREALNHRGVQIGHNMMGLGLSRVHGRPARDGQKKVEAIDPNKLEPSEARALIETGWRIARLGTGQSTDALGVSGGQFAVEDVRKFMRGMIELGLRFVPEERHARFMSEVQVFVETGRLEGRPT